MPRGRSATRAAVEHSLCIDLAEPATREAIGRGDTSGSWRWSRSGREIASIGYKWRASPPTLYLEYALNGAPKRQTIACARTTPRFGGGRLWFVCPLLHRRVRALYLPPGGDRFASRRAWRLVYQSSRESGAERALYALLARTAARAGEAEWVNALAQQDDIFGFLEDARWEKRCAARERRNAIRRLRRRERSAIRRDLL